MCVKFCWPLRELLWAFLPFLADLLDPNFIVRGHSYVNLLDVCDAAIGFGCIDSLSHIHTQRRKKKIYIFFFFRYTDEEVGHKGVLILIPTHEIMRFPQIFSPDKSRWLCCDRERESARERGREIIPTGVCCAGESNNLYEYVKCATASFEDVRTRWPLPERKWRNQGGSELTWIGYSQQDQREATWAPWIFQYDPFYHQGVNVSSKIYLWAKKKKCLYVRGAKGKISFANSTKRPKLCLWREKMNFKSRPTSSSHLLHILSCWETTAESTLF